MSQPSELAELDHALGSDASFDGGDSEEPLGPRRRFGEREDRPRASSRFGGRGDGHGAAPGRLGSQDAARGRAPATDETVVVEPLRDPTARQGRFDRPPESLRLRPRAARPAPQLTEQPRLVRIALPSEGAATWKFRLAVITGVVATWVCIYGAQTTLWGSGRAPQTLIDSALGWLSLVWVVSILPAGLGLVGYLRYRRPIAGSGMYEPLQTPVSFRIVSRGQNSEALGRTVESVRREMRRAPVFPYVIEVVTDLDVDLPRGPDLVHFLVPTSYQTPNRSLFKARALEYVLHASTLPDHGWVMHLDEESWISPSLLAGMHRAIREEEESGEFRIGQGAILYHRDVVRRPFLTLADMIRSGDDLGRFRLQHELGVTLFGLHGSFILTRSSVAKEVGFDFGPEGSITEDAFWALVQMDRGRRSRWIEGYVEEQPAQSLVDFMKQRRRWFLGLLKVVRHAPVRLRWRIPLAISVGLWSLSWVGVLYTYVRLFAGVETPGVWIVWIGNLAFAIYVVNYVIGLKLNLDDWEPIGKPRAAALYAAQVLLIPVFSLLEVASVIWALLRRDPGFHVIKK